MSIFPPELFDEATRYCDISDAAWRIRDAKAAVCNGLYVLNSSVSVA